MSRRLLLAAAALTLFAVLATANAGGYRYGVSDQAFYIPAIARSLDPSLFPRDSGVLDVQMRAWLGDDLIASVLRTTGADATIVALFLYVTGLVLLAGAAVFFARGLRVSSWTMLAALALLTLRHRIPRTGANSLEGYFHPRMFAFALGLWALGLMLRRRPIAALLCVGLAGVAHPTTALWFGLAIGIAIDWTIDRRTLWATAVALVGGGLWLGIAGQRMDPAWLAAFAEKDYLFPAEWPAWAWALNLSYPVALWALYRRRVAWGAAVPGERALVVGLLTLASVFLVSVPLTAVQNAWAVQLQVTRVLWVIDAVVFLYLAWWIVEDVGGGRSYLWRPAVVAALVAASAVRGAYVLAVETDRPLVAWTLPSNDWTAAMGFLRSQPIGVHVLADPDHAWKYGSSVRVAALRDTVLERSKDSAMALYHRPLALRVVERSAALSGFDGFSADQLRAIGDRYDADVLVAENARRFPFRVLYENARFVVYALR